MRGMNSSIAQEYYTFVFLTQAQMLFIDHHNKVFLYPNRWMQSHEVARLLPQQMHILLSFKLISLQVILTMLHPHSSLPREHLLITTKWQNYLR